MSQLTEEVEVEIAVNGLDILARTLWAICPIWDISE